MSDRPPAKDEEQVSQPPTKEKTESDSEPSEVLDEVTSSSLEEEDEQAAQAGRIVILEEREIPFVKERPPNFSPNFKIRIHRIRNGGSSREEKE
ncbi:MAG: hypothetical protein ACFFDP_05870 [Promethearchaeota archaeon]